MEQEDTTGSLISPTSLAWTSGTAVLLAALLVVKKVKERMTAQSSVADPSGVVVNTRMKRSTNADPVEELRKAKKEGVEWAIQQSKTVDAGTKAKIEAMTFKQLQEALQSGAVSAEAVMRVYLGLAATVHGYTNCLTAVIRDALTQAQKMDEEAKTSGYKKSRLWGIPLSVKECVAVKGAHATWGLVKFAGHDPSSEDSYTVAKLRADGMIPFVTTNIPTTALTYLSDNWIFGETSNPHNKDRTCGGSSGGEGAVIGGLGSIAGVGADIGGSVRIPAVYSGCCGFKPSATRCSTHQNKEPVPWRPICMPTEGPMAQDPHALVEMIRSIYGDHFISNNDPQAVPVDFREDLFKEGRTYKIGYFTSDGYIDPMPGNQRVVREAVELLKSKGHQLVPFSLEIEKKDKEGVVIGKESMVWDLTRGMFCATSADGGAMIRTMLEGEPLPPTIEPLRQYANMSLKEKKMNGWWYGKWKGDKSTGDFYSCQSDEAIKIQAGIDAVYNTRKILIQKMKDKDIDLILCPPTISPAPPLALPSQVHAPLTAIMATMFWNAMDFPAGTVTTSKWNKTDEAELEAYPEKGQIQTMFKKGCKNSVGLPLSVQIVAPSFRDEKVLRVMVDLYDAMKKAEEAQKL